MKNLKDLFSKKHDSYERISYGEALSICQEYLSQFQPQIEMTDIEITELSNYKYPIETTIFKDANTVFKEVCSIQDSLLGEVDSFIKFSEFYPCIIDAMKSYAKQFENIKYREGLISYRNWIRDEQPIPFKIALKLYIQANSSLDQIEAEQLANTIHSNFEVIERALKSEEWIEFNTDSLPKEEGYYWVAKNNHPNVVEALWAQEMFTSGDMEITEFVTHFKEYIIPASPITKNTAKS